MDHDHGLANTRGHMHLALRGIAEGIERTSLVRAELEVHHVVVSRMIIEHKKGGPSPPCANSRTVLYLVFILESLCIFSYILSDCPYNQLDTRSNH